MNSTRSHYRISTKKGIDSWDGVHLLAKAMETAGDDPIKIRDGLEKIHNFKGLAGVYNLSAKDHYGHWMKNWSDETLYTLKLKPY